MFDNHYASQIEWRGNTYPTSEHAYQAAKFFETDQAIAELVRKANSPRRAAELASQSVDFRHPDWDDLKVGIMTEVVACKLSQHVFIQEILVKSGELEIVEMNYDDEFWGWGKDRNGQNQLGKIWMKLRSKPE